MSKPLLIVIIVGVVIIFCVCSIISLIAGLVIFGGNSNGSNDNGYYDSYDSDYDYENDSNYEYNYGDTDPIDSVESYEYKTPTIDEMIEDYGSGYTCSISVSGGSKVNNATLRTTEGIIRLDSFSPDGSIGYYRQFMFDKNQMHMWDSTKIGGESKSFSTNEEIKGLLLEGLYQDSWDNVNASCYSSTNGEMYFKLPKGYF